MAGCFVAGIAVADRRGSGELLSAIRSDSLPKRSMDYAVEKNSCVFVNKTTRGCSSTAPVPLFSVVSGEIASGSVDNTGRKSGTPAENRNVRRLGQALWMGSWDKKAGHPASGAIFAAIREVESGCDNFAVGDNGASRGPYQISAAYWADAIEFGGVQWDYLSLVWSRPHCEQVMRLYWDRYGAKTDEERARLHNGGPSMTGTDEYWHKVQRRL